MRYRPRRAEHGYAAEKGHSLQDRLSANTEGGGKDQDAHDWFICFGLNPHGPEKLDESVFGFPS